MRFPSVEGRILLESRLYRDELTKSGVVLYTNAVHLLPPCGAGKFLLEPGRRYATGELQKLGWG